MGAGLDIRRVAAYIEKLFDKLDKGGGNEGSEQCQADL
jgi:hypothetical protein